MWFIWKNSKSAPKMPTAMMGWLETPSPMSSDRTRTAAQPLSLNSHFPGARHIRRPRASPATIVFCFFAREDVAKRLKTAALQVKVATTSLDASSHTFDEWSVVVERPKDPNSACAMKKRELHAVRKMRVGPSESLCRGRLQTATSCFGQKPRW